MESTINLISVYATNFIGLIMMLMILGNASWKIKGRDIESRLLVIMLITVIATCITDPLVFRYDSVPGQLVHYVLYFGNMLLFMANVVVGPCWLLLVTHHLCGEITKKRIVFVGGLCTIAVLLMVVNLRNPIVFSVDSNNIYHRGPLFMVYMVLEFLTLLDAIVVYWLTKKRGGVLRFFPVLQFIVPLVVGTAIQGLYYGVSVIWPSVGVSICGVILGLQNEALFCDDLTGTYNAAYIDQLKTRGKRKSGAFTMMLVDLREFSQINEKMGHAEGDQVLKVVAGILTKTIGNAGIVARFSGDEFLILLSMQDEDKVREIETNIRNNCKKYTENKAMEYTLDVAIGVVQIDFYKQTKDEVLSNLYVKLHEDKERQRI